MRKLYAYVGNDPVDKADPNGTDSEWFGHAPSEFGAMAQMGQLRIELWDAEYPIDQAGLKTGAAILAAVAVIPGPIGRLAQAGSLGMSTAAIRQEKEHTGKVDAKEVAAVAVGAMPGAKVIGEAAADAMKLKSADAAIKAGEALKTTQEVGHVVASRVSAASAVGAARAATHEASRGNTQLPQGDGPCSKASGCN